MKKVINCVSNNYHIQKIELGNMELNDGTSSCYLKFYFLDKEKTERFNLYLKSTIRIRSKEMPEEPIQFRELQRSEIPIHELQYITNDTYILTGNINQAIALLKETNIFLGETKKILEDPNEKEIQKILNSDKKTYFDFFGPTLPKEENKKNSPHFFNKTCLIL